MPNPLHLNTKEAAERMQVTVETVRNLCRSQVLQDAIRQHPRGPWQIPVGAVEAWIKQNCVPQQLPAADSTASVSSMAAQTESNHKYLGPEFMLKEYEQLHLWKIHETARLEQRINFFMTIASAAIGGVLIITSQVTLISSMILSAAVQGILIALLFYGLNILNQVIWRSIRQKDRDQMIGAIKEFFAKLDPSVAAYVNFQKDIVEPRTYKFTVISTIVNHSGIRSGSGLVGLTLLSNSLILGGITLIGLANAGYPLPLIVRLVLLTVISSYVILRLYLFLMIKFLH